MQLGGDPTATPISASVREALVICSKYVQAGDYGGTDEAVSRLVNLLSGVAESPSSVPEEALAEIHRFLFSPSADPMTVDALSLELPKVVVRFASVSAKCREVVEKVLDFLIAACNPRDMLAILCEALDSQIKVSSMPMDFVILLRRLSKVMICIKRHHIQQVKVALPVVLNVIHIVASELVGEDENSLVDIFTTAIDLAASIQSVCDMVGEKREELCAILSLYALQVLASLSASNPANKVSDCVSLAIELSQFLPYCGLSYLGLITGCSVESIITMLHREDWDEYEFITCFSSVNDGAFLAVLWGSFSVEVERAAGEHVTTVIDELHRDQMKRWQAIGMAKYILASNAYPWKIKARSVDLLLNIMDGAISEENLDDCTDKSFLIPRIFAALKAVQNVIICTLDGALRKKAFSAFTKIISDLPGSQRFNMLKSLITNSSSPDMIALLLDLVKNEVLAENSEQCSSSLKSNSENMLQFWMRSALELVELILKPPTGGPPCLPEHSLPVLSALNLYRFILIRESRGETSRKRVLTEEHVRRAYTEWFLPLRTLVSGIEAENIRDNSELAFHTVCALNPIQEVLYRCIELAEEYLDRPR